MGVRRAAAARRRGVEAKGWAGWRGNDERRRDDRIRARYPASCRTANLRKRIARETEAIVEKVPVVAYLSAGGLRSGDQMAQLVQQCPVLRKQQQQWQYQPEAKPTHTRLGKQ